MIFKRKKSAEAAAETTAGAFVAEAPEAPEVASTGPFDISDVPDTAEYLDFGSILVKPVPGLKIRMDVEQSKKRVIAVSLEVAESRVQLMAFSSSKSESLWQGISDKIKSDIKGQNGEIFQREGEYGEELLAKVPQQLANGTPGHVALRFVGVDGPRWFLRAVIGGAAIGNAEAAKTIDDLVRSVIVNRGDKPLPPAELLPLSVPANAQTKSVADEQADQQSLQRPERGPEITQIG